MQKGVGLEESSMAIVSAYGIMMLTNLFEVICAANKRVKESCRAIVPACGVPVRMNLFAACGCVRVRVQVPGWCGSTTVQHWIADGHDRGTVLGPLPSKDAVIASARLLLGLVNRTFLY